MPDKILVEIIEKHLSYEIDMLRLTYEKLEAGAQSLDKTIHDALIESFCVHARSLSYFFANKKGFQKDAEEDAIASDFTTDQFVALDLKPFECSIRRLNKQIFHLTKGRKIDDDEKFNVLGDKDGSGLLKLIEQGIARFTTTLQPSMPKLKCKTLPITVFAAPPSSATTGTAAQTVAGNVFGLLTAKPDGK